MIRESPYFSVHSHCEWSHLDGMGTVQELVAKTVKMGQPGLALTDHGTMAGAFRLYKECKSVGIKPFPGSEMYLVDSVEDKESREHRYHIGLLALNERGYKALVRLSSHSHKRERFHRKPLIDWVDLQALSEHASSDVAVTTGCYFGWVIQNHIKMGRDITRTTMLVERLLKMFPHTFMELQRHNIDQDGITEDELVGDLVEVARKIGMPMVAGQDCHYVEVGQQDAHDMMKTIGYYGDVEDVVFPGGPFHHASAKFVLSQYEQSVRNDISDGHQRLLDLNDMHIPVFDTYKMHVPTISKTPDAKLSNMAWKALGSRGFAGKKKYVLQLTHELEVIAAMEMSNYFLLVEEVCSWCREQEIIINTRGSANGSLLCYLLGITEVDPVIWKTSFERFLDLERRKPPDVDIDVESSQRHLIVDWLKRKFPSTVQMGTYSRLGMSHEVDESTGEMIDTGSMWVQYFSAMKKKGIEIEATKIPPSHRHALQELDVLQPRKAPGAHAAGFVLPADALPIEDYLPTMLIPSSNTTVSQSVMEDVEDAGYLKLDILGVKALGTMNQCLRLIGGKPINDFTWIPWDDPKTCRLLRSGKTEGVFQFDGYSSMQGGKEMKIKSTFDAILCMALYRPAMMDGGATRQYLNLRFTDTSTKLAPLFDPFLMDTRGVPVFQEQIMQMMRAAGLTITQWNDVMKAVKASNDKIEGALKVFDRTKPLFINGAMDRGCTKQQADLGWIAVMSFTDYGFNMAHAVSYGIMAYRSAYLRAHYPREYFTALLQTWAGAGKKELRYRKAARKAGFKLIKPDVNYSDVLWSMDKNNDLGIRQGLVSIHKVGEKAAEAIVRERGENGIYASVGDMINRLPARPVSGGKDWHKDKTLNGVYHALTIEDALASIKSE